MLHNKPGALAANAAVPPEFGLFNSVELAFASELLREPDFELQVHGVEPMVVGTSGAHRVTALSPQPLHTIAQESCPLAPV
jgi:hypothetical protein